MDRYVFRLEALLVLSALLAFLVVAGSGFLVAAFYIALADSIGTPLAAMISGIVCLATASVIALMVWMVQRTSARHEKGTKQAPDAAKIALALGEMLGGDLQSLAKTHRKEIIAAALIAGFAVGVSPKLRRSLRDLLDI